MKKPAHDQSKFKQYQDKNFGEVASMAMRSRVDGATEMFLTDIHGNKKEIITLPDGKKIVRQTEYVEERRNRRKDLKARIHAMDRDIKKQIVERDKLAQELHDVGKKGEGVNAQLSKMLGNARVHQLTVGAAHPYTDGELQHPMMFSHTTDGDDQVAAYAHSLESAYGLAVIIALVNEFSEGEMVEEKEDLPDWDQENARAAISLANTGLKKLAGMSVTVYVWGVQCSHERFIPIIQKCFGDLDDFDQMYYRNTLEHQKFPVVVYRGALTPRVLKARVVMAACGIDAEILLSGHERRSYPDPVKREEYKRVEEGDIMRELNEL